MAGAGRRLAQDGEVKRRRVLFGGLAAFAVARELRAQNDFLRVREIDHVLGKPEAPIVIIEYASFTCWSCARFNMEVLPQVKKRWIDSGKAKLVFRHFPLDNVATRASRLAECSAPAYFFATVEALFRTQDRWARAADPGGEMARVLAGMGVTPGSAAACEANTPAEDKVIGDIQSGQALGVTSTPTLFFNGQNHGNPGDPTAIDAILRKLGR
jgi:protein-disulfide isomerase